MKSPPSLGQPKYAGSYSAVRIYCDDFHGKYPAAPDKAGAKKSGRDEAKKKVVIQAPCAVFLLVKVSGLAA